MTGDKGNITKTPEQVTAESVHNILNHKLIKGETWISIGFKIGVGLSLWGVILGFIVIFGWVFLIDFRA